MLNVRYLLFATIIVVLFILLNLKGPAFPPEVKRTQLVVKTTALAINGFFADNKTLPVSLSALLTNESGIRYLVDEPIDGWGAPLIYIPAQSNEFAKIGSFGRDQKPGGSNENTDIFVEFLGLR